MDRWLGIWNTCIPTPLAVPRDPHMRRRRDYVCVWGRLTASSGELARNNPPIRFGSCSISLNTFVITTIIALDIYRSITDLQEHTFSIAIPGSGAESLSFLVSNSIPIPVVTKYGGPGSACFRLFHRLSWYEICRHRHNTC